MTDLSPRILQGHVLDRLRELPDRSVQTVVTSPPYWGLRAYGTSAQVWGGAPECAHRWEVTPPRRPRSVDDAGVTSSVGNRGASYDAQGGGVCAACGAWRGELGSEPTPDLFVSHLADVFDEVRRVLRDDGTLWLNLGDTYSAGACGYSPNSPSNRAGSLQSGHGGNRDQATRAGMRSGLPGKNLVGIPWRVAFELQRRGWYLRSDCLWAKPNPMPESVRDRPTRAHEYVFLLTKSARYFYDADALRSPYSQATMPEIGEAYSGQSIKGDGYRRHRAQDPSEAKRSMLRSLDRHDRSNLKSVWAIATEPYPDAHFATFPEAIPERCILLGTSERGACGECGAPWEHKVRGEGGTVGRDWRPDKSLSARGTVDGATNDGSYRRVDLGHARGCAHEDVPTVPCVVLDPFAGSGTTLAVAKRLGRASVGIELNAAYVVLVRARVAGARTETAHDPAQRRLTEFAPEEAVA